MLTFYFSNADGIMTESAVLTAGMVGMQVKLEFSLLWRDLSKTVVFSNGSVTMDVVCTDNMVVIPAKILEKPLKRLTVGVYGVSGDGKLAIPTIRAKGPLIQPGVDPTGDPALDPELPIWAQLQGIIGDIGGLRTEDRSSLVAAVNELAEYDPGADGATFTPQVDENGILSWTNDMGLQNPAPVNIMGPRGEQGPAGADGEDGASSTVTMTRSDDVDGSGRSGLSVNVQTPVDGGMSVSMTYLYDGEGIDNVSVETLESEESATAALINPVGSSRTLKLGIPRGKSAYEYARDAGFAGTEEAFAEKFAALCLPDAEEVAF